MNFLHCGINGLRRQLSQFSFRFFNITFRIFVLKMSKTEEILNPKQKAPPPVTVIDLGSYRTKAGIAGADIPRYFIEPIYGIHKIFDIHGHSEEEYIGSEARQKADSQTVFNLFEEGTITDKDYIYKLLNYIITDQMEINQEKKPIIITTPLFGPASQRDTIAEIVFNKFLASSIYFAYPPSLALYTTQKITGCVIDCGENYTQVTSIFDQITVPQASIVSRLGGYALNLYFQKKLKERSYHFNGVAGREVSREVKEKFASAKQPPNAPPFVDFTLPDGNIVQIGEERFTCSDLLFDPSLNGVDSEGLHEMVFESIMRCDIEIRPILFQNIVVCGGTFTMPGLIERFKDELIKLMESNNVSLPIDVTALPNLANAAWIGGSVFGKLQFFPQLVVHKEEFNELGPAAIKRRFY